MTTTGNGQQPERLDMWGVVEVMGHKKYAGRITEQTLGGTALVRVDVPEVTVPPPYEGREAKTYAPFTKMIGPGSIYCITPTTEDVARKAAQALAFYVDPIPVSLPAERQIPAMSSVSEPDYSVENGSTTSDDDDGLPF